MFVFLLILLCIAVFFEGTVTSLPLVLVCLLCLTIQRRDGSVFIFALLAGFILDVLSLRAIGSASLFFVVFVFLLLLYQRKYEIDSYPFVGFATFFGSLLFMLLFDGGINLLQVLICTGIGLLVFALTRMSFMQRKEVHRL
jgi:cell shape-determining protein MreD